MEYLKNLCVLAKFEDESIHQIVVDPEQQKKIILLLLQTSPNNRLHVIDSAITAIDWESDIDLSK